MITASDGFHEKDSAQTAHRGSKHSARIIEVTHATPAEEVFELTIADDDLSDPIGWTINRSERLPSLYP